MSVLGILSTVLVAAIAVLVLAAGAGALWVRRRLQPLYAWAVRSRWPKAMTFEAADRAAVELVSRMTLDERMEQMVGSGMAPMILSILFRGTMAPVYSGANERLGIPPVSFTDGPRGVTSGRSTSFPVGIARAATWDVELQRRVGDAIGRETRAQGANYWGGLCLNIVRHPSMGRAQETCGEDPWLAGEMGAAILEAVQGHNVMACAKHFALNSMETARFKNDVLVEERTLREVYMPQFRKAVEHGVASVMSAYNKVRGEWCGESLHLLTTLLRDDWGFRGFVTSDWMWGTSPTPTTPATGAAAASLRRMSRLRSRDCANTSGRTRPFFTATDATWRKSTGSHGTPTWDGQLAARVNEGAWGSPSSS